MVARRLPRNTDGPEHLEAYRNGPKGVWLVASKAHGEDAPIDEAYPHIHGIEVPGAQSINGGVPKYARRECLACTEGDVPVKPRVWSVPPEPERTTIAGVAEWRWGCLACGANGAADSETSAHGITNLHRIAACPATAWSEEEFEARMLRRQTVTRLYPDEVPQYEHPYRPHPWFD